MQRCGIIEVGTRGIRLVVAQASKKNARGFEVLRTRGGLVNLGSSLSPDNPNMTLDRMEAAATMVEEFFREAADFQPDHIVVLATEVLRRAQNTDEYLDMLPQGLPVFILTPAQEAALSFRASADSFRGHHIRGGELPLGAMMLVDLGGGSAEVVAGQFGDSAPDTSIASTLHLPELGSVGMQTFFETGNGTPLANANFLEEHVGRLWEAQPDLEFKDPHDKQDTGLVEANPEDEGPQSIVALGSAATELAWRMRGASPQSFRSRDVHGQRVPIDPAREFANEIRNKLPESMADVTDDIKKDLQLLFGSFVFDAILKSYDVDHFRVCGFGLRFGAAASLLEEDGEFPPSAPESLRK
jgi:exopolyphosphatase/pppGpp-phosphohydrolase